MFLRLPKMLRVWFIAMLVVGVLGVAGIILAIFFVHKTAAPADNFTETPLSVVSYDSASLPSGFPSDMPREGEEAVINNYTATGGDASQYNFQSSRTFESYFTVAEAFDNYKIYFSGPQSSWHLLSAVDDPNNPDYKALFVENAAGVANINISKNKKSGVTIIDVSFVKSGQ